MKSFKISLHGLQRLQSGFALIDVMIATLILAVGVIAFVNLENVSIKRSQQINNRLQATASAASLIETLRSDRGMVTWLTSRSSAPAANGDKGNFIVETIASPPASQCKEGGTNKSGTTIDIATPSTWCNSNGDLIHTDLLNSINANFSNAFQSAVGKAVMCLRADDPAVIPIQIRVVVVWKNAVGNSFTQATAADCPTNYADPIPNLANLDNVQSDIGFFEIYTRI